MNEFCDFHIHHFFSDGIFILPSFNMSMFISRLNYKILFAYYAFERIVFVVAFVIIFRFFLCS